MDQTATELPKRAGAGRRCDQRTRHRLFHRNRHGGLDLSVAIVLWAREQPHPEKVIEKEEPRPERAAAPIAGRA
jgi:hypothetical protein